MIDYRARLISLHRSLRPLVDRLRLNRLARPIWRKLWETAPGNLVRSRQNGRDWWLDPEVALRGEFQEFSTVEWLRRAIKPGMTVFDIGANVGQMTLEMAELVGSEGRVIAIEPAPGNVAVLRRHLAANRLDGRVMVVEAACCAQDGSTVKFEIHSADSRGVGSGFQLAGFDLQTNPLAKANPSGSLDIPAASVDGLCARFGLRPGVIKIDVEGAEIEVLKGAHDCLRGMRPAIRFGFHPFAYLSPRKAQEEICGLLHVCAYAFEDGVEKSTWGLEEYVANPPAPDRSPP